MSSLLNRSVESTLWHELGMLPKPPKPTPCAARTGGLAWAHFCAVALGIALTGAYSKDSGQKNSMRRLSLLCCGTVTEAVPVLKGITHNFWLVTPGTAGFTSSTQGGTTWKGREGPSGTGDLSSRLTLRSWEAREQFCLVAKQYHKLDGTETISVPVLTHILEEDNVNLA